MKRLMIALGLTGALLSACGGAPAPAQPSAPAASAPTTTPASAPASSKPLTPVTLMTDWVLQSYHAPFYLGISKGYYKDAGLKVSIVAGKGSFNTIQQVAHGNYTFGFADAATAATAISKGVPVKVLAVYLQKSPLSVNSLAKSNITKPSDLIGKTVANTPGTAGLTLWPAFLKANHLAESQVKVVDVSAEDVDAAVMSGKVDAQVAFTLGDVPNMEAKGFKINAMLYADNGVPVLSLGLVVATSYLQAHPDVVNGFVQAADKAWTYGQDHQGEALAAMGSADTLEPPADAATLKLAYQLVHTPNTEGKPVGWMSPDDWTKTLQLLQKYEHLGALKPQADYFTNEFNQ